MSDWNAVDAPRTRAFEKDPSLERHLEMVNAAIAGVDVAAGAPATPQRPVLFIVGAPRSGTTLLHQVLAASGTCGYCSNLIARFPANPALGALIETLLVPVLPSTPIEFTSRAGNTAGWNGPHEFGYFWQQIFPFRDHHEPAEDALAKVDILALSRHVASLEHVAGLPLVFKNPILDFVLPFLGNALPTARFVRLRRPRLALARSLLRTRVAFHGSEDAWYSVRPADAAKWSSLPPAEQIAHQLAKVETALAEAGQILGEMRFREIDYSNLCHEPRAVARSLLRWIGADVSEDLLARAPERFEISDRAEPSDARLSQALADRDLLP